MDNQKKILLNLTGVELELSDSIYLIDEDEKKTNLIYSNNKNKFDKNILELKKGLKELRDYLELVHNTEKTLYQKDMNKNALIRISDFLNEAYYHLEEDETLPNNKKVELLNSFEKLGAIKSKNNPLITAKLNTYKSIFSLTKKIGTFFEMHYNTAKISTYKKNQNFQKQTYEMQIDPSIKKDADKYIEKFHELEKTNFKEFYETLKGFGIEDTDYIMDRFQNKESWSSSTVIEYWNNGIKTKLIDEQKRLLKEADRLGFTPSNSLLLSINKMKDSNFQDENSHNTNKPKKYLPEDSNMDFSTPEFKEQISTNYNNSKKDGYINNPSLINTNIVRFNGLDFDELTKWAEYSVDNEIVSLEDSAIHLKQALNHARELESIGILKKDENDIYSFTDQKAKEILFKNFNKTIEEIDKISNKERTQIKEVKKQQKQEETQATEYKKPTLPKTPRKALKRLSNKIIEDKWQQAQQTNRELQTHETQKEFILLSAVKFKNISPEALENWKDNVVSKRILSEEIANNFIQKSLEIAEQLSNAGILLKKDENYIFVDNRAREIVFNNSEQTIEEIIEINTNDVLKHNKKPTANKKKTNVTSKQVEQNIQDNNLNKLVKQIQDFDWNYSDSDDKEYIKTMLDKENQLEKQIKKSLTNPELKDELLAAINQLGDNKSANPLEYLIIDEQNIIQEAKEVTEQQKKQPSV